MRKNLKPNPHIAPMPVLIVGSYGRDGTPDAMNAAWGTACDYNQICIFMAKEHKSYENIMLKKEFTVSLADRANLVPADYVGVVSATKVPDKVAKTGWSVEKAPHVDAPLFAQLPFTMECRLVSFDRETEALIGEIVNISADEAILDENGKVDVNKFRPLCYIPFNNSYMTLGETAGKAFSAGLALK